MKPLMTSETTSQQNKKRDLPVYYCLHLSF